MLYDYIRLPTKAWDESVHKLAPERCDNRQDSYTARHKEKNSNLRTVNILLQVGHRRIPKSLPRSFLHNRSLHCYMGESRRTLRL